jgi:hypothetical protein
MAEFNSCANLINDEKIKECNKLYEDLLSKGKDPLEYMLNAQNSLQIHLSETVEGNKCPDDLSKIGEIYDWLRDNKIALDDEFREVVDALPGMNLPEKERSALWKKWKSNHLKLREKDISELEPNELKELKFELIDMWHFFMNMMLGLRISSKELFTYYYYKNLENIRRYNSKY